MRALIFAWVVVLLPVGPLLACSANDASSPTSKEEGGMTPPNDGDGDDGGVDAGQDTPPSTPKNAGSAFCLKTIGATITATEACCSAADKATSDYKGLMNAAGDLQTGCGASLDNSLAKRRIQYDDASGTACEAAFNAALASDVCSGDRLAALATLSDSTCRQVIVGVQAAGQPCTADYECKDSLTCFAAGAATEGACASPPPVGKPCGSPKSTTVNLKFGSHRACAVGSHCTNRVCTAPTSGACDTSSDCPADGTVCILHKCSAGRAKQGEPCELPSQCGPGLFCDFVESATVGSCAQKKAAGGACDQGLSECKGVCPRVDAGASASCTTFCGSG
jgi:hypothetical protein